MYNIHKYIKYLGIILTKLACNLYKIKLKCFLKKIKALNNGKRREHLNIKIVTPPKSMYRTKAILDIIPTGSWGLGQFSTKE